MHVSVSVRSLLVWLFDLVSVVAAWLLAFLLRFNFEWPSAFAETILLVLPVLILVQLVACRWAGLYRGIWRFASLPDLYRVLKAVVVSAVALLVIVVLGLGQFVIPRSVVALYPFLLLFLMGGGRFAWRMWRERDYYLHRQRGKPVVVVGAGTAGAMLVRELARSNDWRVVALVDDDRSKWGRELAGKPVEQGGVRALAEVLTRWGARHVILAMPSASAEVLQRVAQLATKSGASMFTVPGLNELMSGRVAINVMRPVKIEDLLGRETVSIDSENVSRMLEGKRLLVTGAGGSIGSELCRQLSRFAPECIVLVETSEFALYMIDQWFKEHQPGVRVIPLVGDVKCRHRMQEIFEAWQPQVVFHAAAYKHVPLMEIDNAWQALRNNVVGTYLAAKFAQRFNAERFVLISTDKAVNPTNVMGASKRLAEMVCERLQHQAGVTRFEVVRFGNVLGSTGSVIPKFQQQIAHGGPVTVTHPDITRYFMSIPEAAQLVLQAASMGQGGEIFVLDMGEPVKIVDLAHNMIRLAGFAEDEIRVEFTGLRPGEKLYEELLADSEETLETPHPKLRIAQSREVAEALDQQVERWSQQEQPLGDEEVRKLLKHWVPEYQPYSFE
ncbi:polysaccharide biosynthesis protein [Pusillimonas sp. CC-YST705]|uniref:Polysaccharide biosynthesis protein n=1 Tax=Mesopusillimonas faecipullorum TaxID=2755040 RepID=A0ABS8CB60_9BURK|nr:nucleoside-diphosphate sugar epimerase/dehydratase [Mesopusillimonas faecipullorum]MCB5363223.1 polysaccharide biosynthesis protein [Mesopusillimonas faecipullorum]